MGSASVKSYVTLGPTRVLRQPGTPYPLASDFSGPRDTLVLPLPCRLPDESVPFIWALWQQVPIRAAPAQGANLEGLLICRTGLTEDSHHCPRD